MKKAQDKLINYLQSIDDAYEKYAKAKGMTYISLLILEEIYEAGDNCTQKQISRDTHYPKQTVNLVVKSFWEDGYVELKEIPTDRRQKYIVLTEKGRKHCEEVVAPLWEKEECALADMGKNESEELVRLLELYCNLYRDGINKII